MRGRQLEALSCCLEEVKKNCLCSILGFEHTFWKIPWGTVQSMFCLAAIRKVYFQECGFRYGPRARTDLTCARLLIWYLKAGLTKLVCKCGHFIWTQDVKPSPRSAAPHGLTRSRLLLWDFASCSMNCSSSLKKQS